MIKKPHRLKVPIEERLLKYISADSVSGCWNWTGDTSKSGYGVIWNEGGPKRAHRVMWEVFIGDIGNSWVLHRCDNRPCVNPFHLWLGSPLDNQRDCISKGRMPKCLGEDQGGSKLTDEKVRDMRHLFSCGDWTYRKLADKFSISQGNAFAVVNRRTWKHIT